jgi:hypothetical protein
VSANWEFEDENENDDEDEARLSQRDSITQPRVANACATLLAIRLVSPAATARSAVL